jgi:hypothetical protein
MLAHAVHISAPPVGWSMSIQRCHIPCIKCTGFSGFSIKFLEMGGAMKFFGNKKK